ncbi:hypothetical protein EFK50_07680 [Nocardioides marmoriginsengisoli]|uniref:Uncharacterized protein n=1 Tax=Nocardioides marmoriginsengisoli TaxID=661483 RepID=A0A3N0CLP7_9ACTN|nr:hypothetical protein [Nocardioides marmoriginsengisoli]RNL64395.1 hypothetical protein EFK50_07680 [Nocardioides marmoriginsengisoli]
MIPLTTADANAGYLIIGAVIGLVGAGIIWFAQRSSFDRRAVRKCAETLGVETIPTAHQFADSLTTGEDEYAERHWSEAMERDCAQSLAIAKHNVDAHRRLASVPVQGKPSGWS